MSSKKSTTSSSTGTQSSTSTPNVPDWISSRAQHMAAMTGGIMAAGSDAYTPGESALQSQAVNNAGNLGLSSAYGQASDTLGNLPQVTGQSVLDNLSSYYNPFQSQVLNPVLADYDYQAGQTRAQQAAQAAAGGAFGGSRYGVQEAQTEGDLARGRASTEGNLLNQMYTQATGLSAQDAANRQAAQTSNQNAALQKAGLLTNLGSTQDASSRANVALQDQVGSQQTDLENAIKQYPLQFQAQIESLLQGINPSMYVGQSSYGTDTTNSNTTQTSDPGVLGGLGMGLQALSMFNPATAAGGGLSNLFSSFRNSSLPPT
jgi:hypothetical protein